MRHLRQNPHSDFVQFRAQVKDTYARNGHVFGCVARRKSEQQVPLMAVGCTWDAPLRVTINRYICRRDATSFSKQVAKLAATRVSLNPNAPTVRTQAKRMDVTRARIYQLLEDCAKVMDVRWPEGRWLLMTLGSRVALSDNVEALGQYRSIRDLFYPQERNVVVENAVVEITS